MKRSHIPLFAFFLSSFISSITYSQGQSTWTGATGGEWGTAANWSGGVPNATGAVANINTALTVNISDTGTGGTYPYTFGTLATNISSGSVVIGSNTVASDVLTAAVSSGVPVINVANSNANIFFYANLEGTQGFEKTGAGKFTFRFNGADQAYSGDIKISGGILGINQNGSLGNNNNDIFIANGARLLAEPGTNSGVITLPSTRTITLTGAQSQIGSNNTNVNLVINGTVTEDAAGKGLVKTDVGKVTLAGTISYTGETRIAAGTLALSGSAALPSSQNLRFNGGAVSTLDLGATSQTVRTIVMDTTTHNRVFTGGGSLTVNGDANLQLGANNGVSYDFSGIDSFTFNRTNRNFNVQTVNVASITTVMDTNLAKSGVNGGVNTISAAQILVGGGNSDGNNGSTARLHLGTTNTFNASTIQVGGFNAGGLVDFQGSLTAPSLKIRATDGVSAVTTWKIGETSSGTRRGEGTVNLTGGTLDAVVADLSIGRHISGGNNLADNSSLIMPGGTLTANTIVLAEKTSTGAPTLTSILTQGGGTVTAGTMTLGKDAGAGATARLLPTYNLNGGTLYATTINTGGGAYSSDSERNLTLAGGTLRNAATTNLSINGEGTTASARINVNVTSASIIHADASQSVTLGANTALTGSGNLSKEGDGTLVIGGASSTYTGAVTVTAGTLLVTGQLGASSVTVNNNGKLAGNGTIGGSVSFAADAKLDFGSSLIVNGGTVTFGSGFDMANIIGLDNTVAEGTYTLISGLADVNLAGVLNVGAENAYDLGGGKSAYFQEGSLQLVVIPEPAAALLGGLGTLLLLRRRRY